MRISFIVPGLGLSGGMLAICEFANRLASRGHTVNVVAPRPRPGVAQVTVDPTVRLCFSQLPVTPSPNRHIPNALVAAELARVTPASDALIATYTPTAIPAILASLLGRGRRHWIFADYDEMFASRPIERRLIRLLPRFFHSIVTYATAGADELARTAGVQAKVVHPGLPRERYFQPPTSHDRSTPLAMYLGDARPRKGLADFLRAAELVYLQVPDFQIRVVTKDPIGIETRVPCEHFVAPDDATLGELYRSSGIFVSTAWYEGLGLPPLEAMASGVPVVLTDQRGCRDYAIDGENCLKVPIQRPEFVADAILRLLTDRKLASKLVSGGARAASQYQWSSAVKEFETILEAAT